MTRTNKISEYSFWIGKIADIQVREKSWNILLYKRTLAGKIQKLYINFQNTVPKQYYQVGDIVEINGLITIDFESNSTCRWGNTIKIVWTDRQTTQPQPKPQAPKQETDFEFENLLEELNNEVKKL